MNTEKVIAGLQMVIEGLQSHQEHAYEAVEETISVPEGHDKGSGKREPLEGVSRHFSKAPGYRDMYRGKPAGIHKNGKHWRVSWGNGRMPELYGSYDEALRARLDLEMEADFDAHIQSSV